MKTVRLLCFCLDCKALDGPKSDLRTFFEAGINQQVFDSEEDLKHIKFVFVDCSHGNQEQLRSLVRGAGQEGEIVFGLFFLDEGLFLTEEASVEKFELVKVTSMEAKYRSSGRSVFCLEHAFTFCKLLKRYHIPILPVFLNGKAVRVPKWFFTACAFPEEDMASVVRFRKALRRILGPLLLVNRSAILVPWKAEAVTKNLADKVKTGLVWQMGYLPEQIVVDPRYLAEKSTKKAYSQDHLVVIVIGEMRPGDEEEIFETILELYLSGTGIVLIQSKVSSQSPIRLSGWDRLRGKLEHVFDYLAESTILNLSGDVLETLPNPSRDTLLHYFSSLQHFYTGILLRNSSLLLNQAATYVRKSGRFYIWGDFAPSLPKAEAKKLFPPILVAGPFTGEQYLGIGASIFFQDKPVDEEINLDQAKEYHKALKKDNSELSLDLKEIKHVPWNGYAFPQFTNDLESYYPPQRGADCDIDVAGIEDDGGMMHQVKRYPLSNKTVFISASLPPTWEKSTWDSLYLHDINVVRVCDAVVAVALAVLSRGGQILSGGHPLISPILYHVVKNFFDLSNGGDHAFVEGMFHADSDGKQRVYSKGRPPVKIYQSYYFFDGQNPEGRSSPLQSLQPILPPGASGSGPSTGEADNFNLFKLCWSNFQGKGGREAHISFMRSQMFVQGEPDYGFFIGGRHGGLEEFEQFQFYFPDRRVFSFGSTGGAARILYNSTALAYYGNHAKKLRRSIPDPALLEDMEFSDQFFALSNLVFDSLAKGM